MSSPEKARQAKHYAKCAPNCITFKTLGYLALTRGQSMKKKGKKKKRGQANYASVIVREWLTCIDHPAANQIFLAGDGEDLSTTDLLRRLGKALAGKKG